MTASAPSHRSARARLTGALFALAVLAAGCTGGEEPAPEGAPAVSDGGGASDGGTGGGGSDDSGASDGGGQTAAALPRDPYPVTPAPDDFEPPEPCSGEGAYYAEVGGTGTPDLPERAGESLTIEATGIEGADAQLTATLGEGDPREIEDITLGETVSIDLWTLSVTSVCEETEQVEFDLIN
ncbi:hypothetical protein BH708_15240 [Brachybacterium sp. P6-10-X1]|uniref:hypothetical protein n=1 Tax=Brachybacterium sp. P6-10-X1 TaxID=1903186 RepID=UPI000971BBB0|nr:hypothetical protein [Brachybacterium sp. P6-10-X1]APX33840.1 hypothetical protein BH708_15240 [Brachybacterium sp. P6-10-X1]